jgi:hypothetical protein
LKSFFDGDDVRLDLAIHGMRPEPLCDCGGGDVCRLAESCAKNGDGGTRVSVELSYIPPAGAFGHAVAAIFGADPKSEMDADLLRMKSMIETGHPPHDAAKPSQPRES